MYDSPEQMTGQFYDPLVRIWMERIRAAENSKTRFNAIAKICNDFYQSEKGFMWDDKSYFNGNLPKPRFKVTIAKAFEFVSIYAPHLFWQYADRKVFSQKQLELTPELFGAPDDEEAKAFGEQIMLQEAQKKMIADFGNDMMGIYLNWSQREQPGTLIVHGQDSVTEALIKGMGLLWPETYTPPGSDQLYTKLTHDTVDNLLIDPDCKDALWESAGYIMCKHTNPIWEVERKFGLERGALEGKGRSESAELAARKQGNQATKDDKTFDCITWYEIWSKVGVGPRTQQLNHHMIDMFDDRVGDYAYLCIAPGVPYPLNAPPSKFYGDNPAMEDDVKEMFKWRCRNFGSEFPCYKDGRWPVSALKFNTLLGSPWPLAPLAPGLGELMAINVITASYLDSAWSNRQQILAYMGSAADELEEALNSDTALAKVKLNDNIRDNINGVIQFLNRPNANTDQLQALEMLSANFNRRVGLNELQYGETKTQVRIASDGRAKQDAISIRPQKMAGDVARWLTNGSQLEMFLAALHVEGKDLTHLLGDWASIQWDAIFGEMDVNTLMREAKATVEASEVQRPNKERDTANTQSLLQYVLPLAQNFAQVTGDTTPLNDYLEKVGDSMDMAEPPLQLPPWQPPKDPEQVQMAKVAQQTEIQKTAAEAGLKAAQTQKTAAEVGLRTAQTQKTTVDAMATVKEAQIPGGIIGEMKHQAEIRRTEEKHQQGLLHTEQDQVQDLIHTSLDHELKLSEPQDGSST
jgi:hypothetical protein